MKKEGKVHTQRDESQVEVSTSAPLLTSLLNVAGDKLLPSNVAMQEVWQTDWTRSNYWYRLQNQTL